MKKFGKTETANIWDKFYVPDRGDIIWLDFDPQSGHEQSGLRPALVLSPKDYNKAAGLAVLCPITSKIKGYPFEVLLPPKGKITGVILSDQIKNLDWQSRKATFIVKATADILEEVIAKTRMLL